MSKNFRALYCARHAVPQEQYESDIFNRALYCHARCLKGVLKFFSADYFVADLDFVRGVAELRSRRDFSAEADEFQHNTANRGILRQIFRLRISASRMRRLVDEEFEYARSHPPIEPAMGDAVSSH